VTVDRPKRFLLIVYPVNAQLKVVVVFKKKGESLKM